jgi:hypothetical protein
LRTGSGGAAQPVVDRLAQPFGGDRRDGYAIYASGIQCAQMGKKIRRCLA